MYFLLESFNGVLQLWKTRLENCWVVPEYSLTYLSDVEIPYENDNHCVCVMLLKYSLSVPVSDSISFASICNNSED